MATPCRTCEQSLDGEDTGIPEVHAVSSRGVPSAKFAVGSEVRVKTGVTAANSPTCLWAAGMERYTR